ncbi:MAG: hypothetical protein AAGN35_15615 [Bacteroidota bacterium]
MRDLETRRQDLQQRKKNQKNDPLKRKMEDKKPMKEMSPPPFSLNASTLQRSKKDDEEGEELEMM